MITAAHVVADAVGVRVLFNADLPGERSVPAQVVVADTTTDIAVLSIAPPYPGGHIVPVLFGTLGGSPENVQCTIVGFPRFKLRSESPGSERYRDSVQANGVISPLSNWREGSLEIMVEPPAPDPDPRVSPWEGMSGAAVWCRGRVIGVVSKHHPADGLNRLAAVRIDRLYASAESLALDRLHDLASLPAHRDQLADVSKLAYPGDLECPYPGLKPFTADEERFFFGRNEIVQRLVDALASDPLVALVGASGSGKSSVLCAGLIPEVAAGAGHSPGYRCTVITPTADPLGQLMQAISEWSGKQISQRWDDLPSEVAKVIGAAGTYVPMLLVVDQMEELHTLCDDSTARQEFVRGLLALAGDGSAGHRVVIGVRTDFYDRCIDDPDLGPAMEGHQVMLRAMGPAGLRSAIDEPAQLVGLHVAPSLTEMLLADVGDEPGNLPLLSHALLATFERRRGRQLEVDDYIATGRIEGAINKTAEAAYGELDSSEREVARAIFLRCTAGDGEIPDTRRPVKRADLDAETFPNVDAVLGLLAKAHLVTLTSDREGQDTVEVVHEVLIRSWQRLAGWLDLYNRDRAVHQKLISDVAGWKKENQSPGWLYQQTVLTNAKKLADNPFIPLTRAEREFLAASENAEKKRARRRRQRALAIVILLLVALSAGGVAFQRSQAAALSARIASAQQLTANAGALRDSQPRTSLLLGLAAMATHASAAGRAGVLATLTQSHYFGSLSGHRAAVNSIAFSPRQFVLASGGDDGTVILWNMRTRTRAAAFTPTGQAVNSVAFSPGGTILAVQSGTQVSLWKVTNPRRPHRIAGFEAGERNLLVTPSALFGPTSRILITSSDTWTVSLWDISDPSHPRRTGRITLGARTGPASELAIRPDGRQLAIGSRAGSAITLYQITSRGRARRQGLITYPRVASTGIAAVGYSPDGQILATASGGDVRLWDISDPARPVAQNMFANHSGTISNLAFSRDGVLVSTGTDDLAYEHIPELVIGHSYRTLALRGHTDKIYAVGFDASGTMLATAGADRTINLWRTYSLARPRPFAGIAGPHAFNLAAYSPSGQIMIAGTFDSMLGLWNTADSARPAFIGKVKVPTDDNPAQLATLGENGVQAAAFSPDGKSLATASFETTYGGDERVMLWHLGGGSLTRLVTLPGKIAYDAVAFSPVGHVLAAGGAVAAPGGTRAAAALWDVADPAHPRHLVTLDVPAREIRSVAFSRDGRIMALAARAENSRDVASLWDVTRLAHPRLIAGLPGLGTAANAVVFSHDGQTLAVSTDLGAVLLWDVTRTRHPVRLGVLAGNTGAVRSVSFSPDDRTMITGGADKTAVIWDLTNRSIPVQLGVLTGQFAPVYAVFSPNGRDVAVASQNGTLRWWDLSDLIHTRSAPVAEACALLGPWISPSEWSPYVDPDMGNSLCNHN